MKFRSLIAAGVFSLSVALLAGDAQAGDDNAKKIIGSWERKMKEATVSLEFTKDGKLTVSMEFDGKTLKAAGTYKIKGDDISVVLDFGGKEKKDSGKIKKLTATEFHLDKGDGKVEEYTRKKKKKK